MSQSPPDALLGPRLRDSARGGLSRPARGDVPQLLFLASQEPVARAPAWTQLERAVTEPRRSVLRRHLWPALAFASLIIGTSAAAGPSLWRWLRPVALQTQSVTTASPPPPLEPKTPTAMPGINTAARAPHVPKARPRSHAMVRAPVAAKLQPATPSLLGQESSLLGEALTALRKHNDPALALQRLDEYARRFPAGQLSKEAQHTKVQALLMQKQTAQALALLDEMSLSAHISDRDALTLRGELRAQARRCTEAQQDFGLILSQAHTGASAERALFGRATCLLEQRQTVAARAALEDYLRVYPAGAHAAQARRALGR